MPDRPITILHRSPRLTASYLRAAVPRRRRSGEVPPQQLVLPNVRLDPAHVARYREVCGWPQGRELPVTYPHILGFGLTMALLTRPDFPLAPIGLVHLHNSIRRLDTIDPDTPLTLRAWADPLQDHPSGVTVDVHTTLTAADSQVPQWRSVSTYLRRGPRGASSGPAPHPCGPDRNEIDTTWRVARNMGRRYASVSGDRNPIHLHPLTARPFGFRRAIAHGMWTKARCLALLESSAGGAPPAPSCQVEVTFRTPVLLGSDVRLHAGSTDEGWAFELGSPNGDRWHLRGHLSTPGS
ncbi:MaoC/PaaZ C-terminal domain-containing protein [Lipingzhangella sp. LS1_29]|uniref:MaoC/PaaZ C-terminal domain-containing protein n=1 Tax=Lipingzhangella rawalii TaxID=2055835 RepID=A0ABU2H852_9ACTN|nr:MaoC/PaaZ C-terminal domain-containing protein [Lipingzhangella rawalii]MDS1271029.1 MaoC/PaaZ C-terminal domain-containing protein [Lipingzhangella rawalii]